MSGLTGSQTSKVELDPRIEEGSAQALGLALQTAGLPYQVNRNPTIAAFSPQQQAAFEGAGQAASAFGLPGLPQQQYLPQPEQTAEGYRGYSTGSLYDTGVERSIPQNQLEMVAKLLKEYRTVGKKIQNMEGDNGGGK